MALKRRDVAVAAFITAVAWGCVASWCSLLRVAGYAFTTGVFLSVSGLAAILLTSHRPAPISTIPAGPAFQAALRWNSEVGTLRRRQAYVKPSLQLHSSLVSEAIESLLDLILQDFVFTWYLNISGNRAFVDEVDRSIRTALRSMLRRLRDKDLGDIITSRLVPIVTTHFSDFNDAERSIRGKKLTRSVTESEELDLAIAAKFRDGRLHPAASLSHPDTKMIQQGHLRSLTARILPKVLPENMLASRAVFVLVREIISCAVLFPVVQLVVDSDTWNQLIENHGRSMLQDRSTVRKLRAALDQHASPSPRPGLPVMTHRLAPGDNERKFERFIRGIRKVNNLSDARRFRSEVASQLKRDSIRENEDLVYLRRLDVGKRLLDERVKHLAAGGERRVVQDPSSTSSTSTSHLENATLSDVLKDSFGLSYFMEYMDRQQLMPLVQFSLVVDGLRNPLEDDGPDDDDQPLSTPHIWTQSDRIDLQQIYQAYLSRPELRVPESSRKTVRDFLHAGASATAVQYHSARRCILKAQSAVLEEMQAQHFQAFKRSDLFYKCLASHEASQADRSAPLRLASRPPGQGHSPIQRVAQSSPSIARHMPRSIPSTENAARRFGSASGGPTLSKSREDSPTRPSVPSSIDEKPSTRLFAEDDGEQDGMGDSVQSLSEDRPLRLQPDTKVVQAMEQALSNILDYEKPQTAEDLRASLFGDEEKEASMIFEREQDDRRKSLEGSRSTDSRKEYEKPSLSSLGLVSAASRIGVFVDDDLFEDESRSLGDEVDDRKEASGTNEDEGVHEAAPGDLGLAEAITALSNDIDRLVAQEAVVDSLTKKAELTNNTSELRILRKSKQSLQREMRRKELQRQQYVMQESDNSLYGRSRVRIKNIEVGREEDGREFALYVVEVQRNAGGQMPAASWTVTRRFSEFHDLHQRLRSRYAPVRNLDFPRRRMVMKFQSEFLRKRRAALEIYLRELLRLPDVCRSRDLRAFLSQSITARGQDIVDREDKKDMMTRFYDSVADGMDDILRNIPVLDQISVAGQSLIAAATNQLHSIPLSESEEDSFPAAEAEAELNAYESKEQEPFIKPICDIFLEVFELNRGNNWLRGRAVVVVLQQLLGGTIERKVRENVKMLYEEDFVLRCINVVKGSMWPNGKLRKNPLVRGAAERSKSRREASLMLATLVPDLAGSVVGRVNAQAASRRIFATFNNSKLK